MLLVIDNYDSFTWNLVHYIGEAIAEKRGAAAAAKEIVVRRNDALSAVEAAELKPDAVVLSPGPGAPDNAGICVELVKTIGDDTPLLGVCLGHQAIGCAYGATVGSAGEFIHGKTSPIRHDGGGVFRDLPSPLAATRYHSLIVERGGLPDCFEVTAELKDGAIMGLAHRNGLVEGVQFHPESIATEHGRALLTNFLRRAEIV